MVAPYLFSTIADTGSNSFVQTKAFIRMYMYSSLYISLSTVSIKRLICTTFWLQKPEAKSQHDYNLAFLLPHWITTPIPFPRFQGYSTLLVGFLLLHYHMFHIVRDELIFIVCLNVIASVDRPWYPKFFPIFPPFLHKAHNTTTNIKGQLQWSFSITITKQLQQLISLKWCHNSKQMCLIKKKM